MRRRSTTSFLLFNEAHLPWKIPTRGRTKYVGYGRKERRKKRGRKRKRKKRRKTEKGKKRGRGKKRRKKGRGGGRKEQIKMG